jgi:hypothetical protein
MAEDANDTSGYGTRAKGSGEGGFDQYWAIMVADDADGI